MCVCVCVCVCVRARERGRERERKRVTKRFYSCQSRAGFVQTGREGVHMCLPEGVKIAPFVGD